MLLPEPWRGAGEGVAEAETGLEGAGSSLYPPHRGQPHRLFMDQLLPACPGPKRGSPCPVGCLGLYWHPALPTLPGVLARGCWEPPGLLSQRRGVGVRWWWQHPLLQAPTMSSQLLLLAVLPALLGPPAAMAQKRSQGGC